jgi:hypothetical protein
LDTIFDLLSKERRRYALYYLEEEGGKVPVEELVETVAEWEASGEEVPDEKYRRVRISLQHRDLPKSTDAEFVEYDADEGVVQVSGMSLEADAVISIAKVIEEPKSNG